MSPYDGDRERLQRLARHYATEALRDLEAAGAIRPLPTLLDLTYRDVQRLVRQGAVLSWLADQLYHHWASRPDVPLSDVLKTEPRERVEGFARMLGQAGIHDLDDLLLPDLEVPDD